MGNALRKFVPRAPRYTLKPQDRKHLRFSLEHSVGEGGIEQTIMVNLSESGVAFLVSSTRGMTLGDRIKVEIPIPSGEQIAWWARVVRMEEYNDNDWYFGHDPFKGEQKYLVGLRFEELPEPHSKAIRQGIEKSFMAAMRAQQYRNWLYFKLLFFQNVFKISALAVLTVAVIGFIYWLSRPDANYDEQRGAPWGQRYK